MLQDGYFAALKQGNIFDKFYKFKDQNMPFFGLVHFDCINVQKFSKLVILLVKNSAWLQKCSKMLCFLLAVRDKICKRQFTD